MSRTTGTRHSQATTHAAQRRLQLAPDAGSETIGFVGWVCPLTPLENHFRRLAGQSGYAGGFIEHYIIPVLYPTDWTISLRVVLGTLVLVVNALAYGVYFWRIAKARPSPPTQ